MAPPKAIAAQRAATAIVIDGNLDDPEWKEAPEATDFRITWPTPGQTPSQPTKVKILYDDDAIYIGAYLFDNHPDSIFHRLTKRDALENSDHFSVRLDTYQDGQNAVEFGVTPDNVQFDIKFSTANANDNNSDGEDRAWDAVWNSAAKITDDGWIVELAIPYSALRFPKQDQQRWNVNFFRGIRRHGERSSWNEIRPEIAGTLNQMGSLTGLQNLRTPKRLSVTPFVAGYANNTYNQKDPAGNGWNFPYAIGMDLKYGLSDAFTLDATLVPDFNQARSDNAVLNLSPFEVRFDENRPFFTEGAELFNKGGLFYSRRIGARPIDYGKADDNLTEEEAVVENPAQTRLLNATKISGRTRRGLGVGWFNAVEGAAHAVVRNEQTGEQRRVQTSPLTNKSVAVLDQNLPHNSSVTLVNTNVLRSGSTRDANVTGLLFNLRDKAQQYALSGRAIVSDRVSVSDRESGFKTQLECAKTSGNLLWGANWGIESDRYNTNDLGILFAPNENVGNAWVNYNRYKPWWKFNNFWSGLWIMHGHLYKPAQWTETQMGGNFGFSTRSLHNFSIGFNSTPWGESDYFEPRTSDFSRFYRLPASTGANFWYSSDQRQKLVYGMNGGGRVFAEGGRRGANIGARVRWRASNQFTLGLNAGGRQSLNNVGWVKPHADGAGYETLSNDDIMLGYRDITGMDNVLEMNYAFNNRMNVSFYARHYWQRVQYRTFGALEENGALRQVGYSGLSTAAEPLNDIAANFFNIDLIYTWRFAPGSDLVVVYKNSMANESAGLDAAPGYIDNAGQLPEFSGANNLSVKVLYFLDYDRVFP